MSPTQSFPGRTLRSLWPLLLAVVVGVVASASLATIRIKVENGETVESMAERYYGDMRKSAVIRAANKINDGEQPADGAFLKIPRLDDAHRFARREPAEGRRPLPLRRRRRRAPCRVERPRRRRSAEARPGA